MDEKNHKRKVKTPAQVEALERLYSEHQYPPESTKQELAETLGLTEKQVSGWFCHRRLKDRKGTNDEKHTQGTKQDRSSGVIQDRGSGLRQDSCGSTKQEDYIHSEPREVESKRLNNNDSIPHAIPTNELPHHPTREEDNSGTADDVLSTSSGSTSPLPDLLPPQNANHPFIIAKSGNLMHSGNVGPAVDLKVGVKRSGPSGYLKVKAKIENPAIAAVKRQLGRQYREDGPPLAVEFDPLPPDAFETSNKEIVDKAQYAGESIQLQSPDGSRVFKQPIYNIRDEETHSKMSSHDSDFDGHSIKMMHSSYNNNIHHRHHKPYSSHQLSNHKLRYASMEMNYDSAGETQFYDVNHYELKSKHGGRMQMDSSVSTHHRKVIAKQPQSQLYNYKDKIHKVPHKEYFESEQSNLPTRSDNCLGFEDKGTPRTTKGELYGGRKGMKTYHADSLRVKVQSSSEMKVGKRTRDELPPHQHYARRASTAEIPPWTDPVKGCGMEIGSSFSEDETAEASSSGD